MEDSWWYRGRARVISRSLTCLRTAQGRALDVGAGYGGMADTLKKFAKELDGTEPDEESRAQAKQRGYTNMYAELGDTRLPYNLIAMFDVLEHIENDSALLAQLNTMLEPRGYLALTIPAFQWLWSEHDVAHHHFRRYTTSSVRKVLEQASFEIVYMSYWNMALFIPAALVRLTGKSGAGSLALPKIIDKIFFAIVYAESFLLPWIRLPFGTGIVVLARKK